MNYYPFHVGDYAAHTKHLTLMGDLAYRRLLDLYYINELPLPLDHAECARKIGMRDHIQDVSEVLSDFFLKSEDGYRSKRCDEEIETYQAKSTRAKQANSKRWEGKKSDSALKSDLKSDADQIPTNNQEPITNNQRVVAEPPAPKARRKQQLPADFYPNEIGESAAVSKGLVIPAELQKFTDYHRAKGNTMADWQAAWRTWVGNARPPIGRHNGETAYQRSMRLRVAEAAPALAQPEPSRVTAVDFFNARAIDVATREIAA